MTAVHAEKGIRQGKVWKSGTEKGTQRVFSCLFGIKTGFVQFEYILIPTHTETKTVSVMVGFYSNNYSKTR